MRVAIIGLGHAGTDLHLPALSGLPSASVVGACDPDAQRRNQTGRTWRIPVFADADAMLSSVSPDVVIVATPPSSHASYCLLALQRGTHVVCEKPFVSSLPEADAVIAAAAAARKHVAVNHEFSEMPIFRALLNEVRGEQSGRLRFAQLWQLIDLPPGSESGWRGAMTQRTLFEAGVHLVDLMLALYGEKPIGVHAVTSPEEDARGSEAVVLVSFEFSGGRLAQLVQNRICKGERQYLEVRADTDRASFRASFGGRARVSTGLFRSTRPHLRLEYGSSGIAWREVGANRTQLARNAAQPNMRATRELLNDALASFRRDEAPRSGAQRARDVLEVIAAAYLSDTSRSRVCLDGSKEPALMSVRMGAASSSGPHV